MSGRHLVMAVCASLASLAAGAAPPSADANIPVVTGNGRVDELLSRMTFAEKLHLIHDTREDARDYQGQAGYLAGVPRLGIPGLRLADGPPGVLTRHPSQAETATMGVAATFHVALAEQNGVVIGREARALGIDVSLQPFVNIDRDISFRRAYNTFGEDPLLTSRIGAAEIRGIQSQRVMAMAKHFIAYDTAANHVWVDQQTLHEVYLAPFEAAVDAGVASIMCSYNHINGPYACGSEEALIGILRQELGFKGFVTSDWGATHSAQFLKAGLDVEMIDGPDSTGYQEPAFLGAEPAAIPPRLDPHGDAMGDIYGGTIPEEPIPPVAVKDSRNEPPAESETIEEALRDGTIDERQVTRAAGHVLYEMERFGFLSRTRERPVIPQSIAANARVIQKTAEEAAVLLKNDKGVLPLRAAGLSSTVFIGPTAAQVDSIGISGERSMGLTGRQVGPVEAVKRLSGVGGLQFAVDDDMTGSTVPAAVLNHDAMPGLRRSGSSGEHIDATIEFTLAKGNALPANSTVTWTGALTVAKAGRYWMYLQALGANATLYIDDHRIGVTGIFQGDVHGDILQANQDSVLPTRDGLDNVRHAVELTAAKHSIRVCVSPDTSNSPTQVRLNWYTPEQRMADHLAAIQAAKEAKVAVVFVWARRYPPFELPGEQNRLIEEVAAVNPNTVVVLNTSQPVALPWLDRVRGILEMWWPGDEGGWATARILLGKTSPAGRLPITWGRQLEDYPATDPRYPERSAEGVNHRTTYTEGVNVGYRWFDHERSDPLFAFGYGLSYTSFAYSGLHVARTGDGGLDVSIEVHNTGDVDSDEVPQVYLSAPETPPEQAQFASKTLVAFDRIRVRAHQARRITLHVARRQLQYWSTVQGQWVTVHARRTLSVGASSQDLRLKKNIDFSIAGIG